MRDYLYEEYTKKNCILLYKNVGPEAKTFDPKADQVNLCVQYPTRDNGGWYFFLDIITAGKSEIFEIQLDRDEIPYIKQHIRNMRLSEFWEDPTDWTNVVCH